MRHCHEDVLDLLPLPRATFHALVALDEGVAHGYGVKRRVEELSDGLVRMAPGTLYETLHRMREQGLVEEVQETPPSEDDHAQRSYYRLTPFGRRVLATEVQRIGGMIDGVRARLREAGGA